MTLHLADLLRFSVLGLAVYLSAQQALMVIRGRERAAHAMALLLSLNAAAFVLLRYWQRFHDGDVAPANVRAQFTAALLVAPLGLAFLRALSGRRPGANFALGLGVCIVVAFTPWWGDLLLAVNDAGRAEVSPLAAAALGPYVIGLCAAILVTSRGINAHLWRSHRLVMPFVTGAYLLAALNDIAVQGKLYDGGLLLEYAFAFHLVTVGYGLANRIESMYEHLEATVEARTRELEEAIKKLLHADRMASVGTLSAGIAHEINNPLSYVLGNIETVRDSLVAGDDDRAQLIEILEEAQEGAERVRRIVGDLKTFSRPTDVGLGPVSVGQAVQQALNLTGNELRHHADVSVEVDPGTWVVASEGRLVQVLVNLLVNAGQAVGARAIPGQRIDIRACPTGRDHILIEIADTGPGLAEAVLPRVFDPFFTTKPVGIGTGLGLSICHGIVRSFNGELRLENRPGRGAVARVTLPRARADAPAAAAA